MKKTIRIIVGIVLVISLILKFVIDFQNAFGGNYNESNTDYLNATLDYLLSISLYFSFRLSSEYFKNNIVKLLGDIATISLTIGFILKLNSNSYNLTYLVSALLLLILNFSSMFYILSRRLFPKH